MLLLMAVLLAYALGSVSFAILLSKLSGGPDPRTYGSGNPGATNVLRSGNKKIALAVLILDALKGAIPVWVVYSLDPAQHLGYATPALVGFAAFLGHLFPVFHQFKGGKGVATALGVVLGLHLGLAAMVMVIFAGLLYAKRYVSLAAMAAAASAPVLYALALAPSGQRWGNVTALLLMMAVFLIQRHHSNIERLKSGQESRWLTPKEKREQNVQTPEPELSAEADAAPSTPPNQPAP